MSTPIQYANPVLAPTGGVNALSGQGMDYHVTLALPSTNGEVTLTLTDNLTGTQTQVGSGNVTGINPTFLSVFNNKVYALAGATAYFTAVDQPVIWNDPTAAGNGFITMRNYYSTPESLAACAPYQGSLLFVSRRTVQVWHVDPDPANYAPVQILPNIGTVAGLTVQPVGDMDVYMLADNGVRSVRVRDASNNAIIADVGTPIDAIVQPILSSLTDAQKAAACGIVDPSANRYWVYVPTPSGAAGSIYTFSYFPGASIAAWGTYAPTYQAAVIAPALNYSSSTVTYTGLTVGQRYAWLPGAHEVSITNGTQVLKVEGAFVATATTATVTGNGATATYTGALSQTTSFVPTRFLTYQGQVWVRAGNALYQYGGASNQVYDNSGVNWTTPYMDGGSPGTRKQFESVDAAFQGSWAISASADYTTGGYKLVYNNNASTFLLQAIGWEACGTHYSFSGVESSSGYALFSAILCHDKQANEK